MVTLDSKSLADLRLKAEHGFSAPPVVFLALLGRIAELEATASEAMAALKRANDGLRALQAMDRAIEQQRALERGGMRGDPQ